MMTHSITRPQGVNNFRDFAVEIELYGLISKIESTLDTTDMQESTLLERIICTLLHISLQCITMMHKPMMKDINDI